MAKNIAQSGIFLNNILNTIVTKGHDMVKDKKKLSKKRERAYLLVMIRRKKGYINDTIIEEITWLDLEDLGQMTTTLDPSYRNYKNWYEILLKDHPEGIYTNLKVSGRLDRHGTPILSADSKPELLLQLDTATVEETLVELTRPKLTKYQELFGQ